jgi:spore coat polysaccharide biosynthesis protein SpsF
MGTGNIQIERAFVFVQARMGSRRFPGKTLEKLMHKTLLENVCDGIPLDRLVILTSQNPLDDPLVDFCTKVNYQVFRGAEIDVFERFLAATKKYVAPYYIRLTGDNPCIYKPILPVLIDTLENLSLDYCVSSELPLGGAAEAFTRHSLFNLANLPWDEAQAEHVTAKYYEADSSFSWKTVPCGFAQLSSLRLTVDEPQDLDLMRNLAKEVGRDPCEIKYSQIERLFAKQPSLFQSNRNIHQRKVTDLAEL